MCSFTRGTYKLEAQVKAGVNPHTKIAPGKQAVATRRRKAGDRLLNWSFQHRLEHPRLEQAFDESLLCSNGQAHGLLSSHMDEFFAVRVAGLDQVASGPNVRSADGRDAQGDPRWRSARSRP
jgi:hypothetical protein